MTASLLGSAIAWCVACGSPTTNADVVDAIGDARDAASADTSNDTGPCRTDLDCDDRVFCNGVERCMVGAPDADSNGCVRANPPSPCALGETCDESQLRCIATVCPANPDADGDGHRSMACGGDDCDDNDPQRYPGHREVCVFDADAGVRVDPTHDEDCDIETVSDPVTADGDLDGDGYIDRQCCNADPSGGLHCGNDCADLRPVDGIPASFMTRVLPGNVHPMQGEICNGIDDDCNGHVDDNVASTTYYPDCDGDTFGAPGGTGLETCSRDLAACNGHPGVGNALDCDDTSPSVSACGPTDNGLLTCMAGRCVLGSCDAGFTDCDGDPSNGCETHTASDTANCGACGAVCPAVAACHHGACGFDAPTGSPDFTPTMDTVLPSGVNYFGRVTIPAGVRVTVVGDGTLRLIASGPVRIDGTVDLSGGPGAFSANGGGGGWTGNATRTSPEGIGGRGGVAHAGGDGANAAGRGGAYGGGAGGTAIVGSGGGGGPAGGGGGGVSGAFSSAPQGGVGGADASPANAHAGGNGGGVPYDGATSSSTCAGGGGSIGPDAAGDLAATSTFQPGSGGGGSAFSDPGSYGGGGGGGALLIASETSLSLGSTAVVRANGGSASVPATCGPGGGSGGVVFLAAPAIDVAAGASVTAIGGTGANVARGGLGRIRVAVGGSCTLATTAFNPPLESGCTPSMGAGTRGRAFVGPYPF